MRTHSGLSAAFDRSSSNLGWSTARTSKIENRYGPGRRSLPTLVADLVSPRLTSSWSIAQWTVAALLQATRRYRSSSYYVSDPVEAGLVASLARPGGNLTGLLHVRDASAASGWRLLKELAPRLARAALVANPKNRL